MSWNILHTEAERLRDRDPLLAKVVIGSILSFDSFAPALCRMLAVTFRSSCFDCDWEELFLSVFNTETYKESPTTGGVSYEPDMPDLVSMGLLDLQVI